MRFLEVCIGFGSYARLRAPERRANARETRGVHPRTAAQCCWSLEGVASTHIEHFLFFRENVPKFQSKNDFCLRISVEKQRHPALKCL